MMTRKRSRRILVVDDDSAFRVGTVAMLEDHGYHLGTARNGEEATRQLAAEEFDLVVSDVVMPVMGGVDLLKHIREQHPSIPVLMITGFGSVGTAVEAMKLGASDYVTKPVDNDELLLKVERVLVEREKELEIQRLRKEVQGIYSLDNIVGQSDPMKEVYRLVRQVAESDVTVLIQGETGTGKELVAKAIHFHSTRRNKPFVVINCSALSETLLESELFGHEKGAFTGAHRQRLGRFEEGDTGTVFLDEIGELPLQIQAKLLRVLQEMEIQRVGGNEPIKVNVRLIAATNRNLEEMVHLGSFREDLYYRINVFPLRLPPLRERLDDLPTIIDHLIKKHGGIGGSNVKGISPSLFPALMAYQWRGNIRELENLVKRAIIKTQGETIVAMDVPFADEHRGAPTTQEGITFKEYVSRATQLAESTYLMKMLDRFHGNISAVAHAMGVDRKTIYRIADDNAIDISKYRGTNASSEELPPQ